MATPVNKNALEKIIETNLPTQPPGAQLITAQKLRESLTPIVNSTFGLKTIWAGRFYYSVNASVRDFTLFTENYYDPNYFPPVQDTNSVVLNSILNKYSVTSVGSNCTNGSFKNVSTSFVSGQSGSRVFGGGLTFDVTIAGGQLTSITVNNPGSGYSHTSSGSTLIEIQVGIGFGGTRPIIKFNMQNTIWPSNNNIDSAGGWFGSYNNVFMPNIANLLPPANNSASDAVYPMLFYTDNAGFSLLGLTQSRLTDAKTNTIGSFTTTGTLRPNLPGFYFAQVSQSVSNASIASGYLEIKFPITSQP